MQKSHSNHAELKEAELIEAIIKGEEKHFETLIRRHNRRLYRTAFAIMNEEEEIEDLMQTAYINAYLNIGNFGFRSSFSTWLTRILVNECLKRKKAKSRTQTISEREELREGMQNPVRDLMNKELKQILESRIRELPEKYRVVFILREIEELSTAETMEVLELSESNVKVRLNRAKEMLRAALKKEYQSAELFEFNLIRCDRISNFVMSAIGAFPKDNALKTLLD